MLYDNVMTVWTRALTTANKLVLGIAQSIESQHDVGALLGLSAWHLYPDMYVLAQENQLIHQKDKLVRKGCLLTLGLQGAPRDNEDSRISWSMPLASLRYYGPPVISDRQVDVKNSRVTFDEILQIALGSAIRSCRLGRNYAIHRCFE